jgi:hypothetical protein
MEAQFYTSYLKKLVRRATSQFTPHLHCIQYATTNVNSGRKGHGIYLRIAPSPTVQHVCHSVLRWFESMSHQSGQRCAWVWWSERLEQLANEEWSKENGERWGERERYWRSQSVQYFHFVSIWLPLGSVTTGQSQWISRIDRSTIPVMALFSSSVPTHTHTHTSIKETYQYQFK